MSIPKGHVGSIVTLTTTIEDWGDGWIYWAGERGRVVGIEGDQRVVDFGGGRPLTDCGPEDYLPGARLVPAQGLYDGPLRLAHEP